MQLRRRPFALIGPLGMTIYTDSYLSACYYMPEVSFYDEIMK